MLLSASRRASGRRVSALQKTGERVVTLARKAESSRMEYSRKPGRQPGGSRAAATSPASTMFPLCRLRVEQQQTRIYTMGSGVVGIGALRCRLPADVGEVAMRFFKWIGIGLLALAALTVTTGQLGLLQGTPPDDLGVRSGRFKPPSATANSVSSQAGLWPGHPQREAAHIAPLALRGGGPATIAQLQELLSTRPGVRIVHSRSDYLRVEFRTSLLKFVDDAEFWFDPASQAIELRSASRVGRQDFGVNRQRIEMLRAQLAE